MLPVRPFDALLSSAAAEPACDLLEHAAALIGVYDDRERLRYANAAFRAGYFVEPDAPLDWTTLMRRNFAARRGTVIQTADIDAWIASVRSRRGKASVRTYESDLHDGRWIWVVETMQPNGWILYVGTDVTSLKASERHLRHAVDTATQASQTDELTGVSNRRHVLSHLELLIDAAGAVPEDGSSPEAVAGHACLIDIDHFKAINDTLGHQAGDEVLVNFARLVRRTVRLRDAFGRVGGEEFLLLLPGPSLTEATGIIARVFDAVRAAPLLAVHPEHRITVSAGLVPITGRTTAKEVYARCDGLLYRAKAGGRDRLEVMADAADGSAHGE